jgi:hypothetical protein
MVFGDNGTYAVHCSVEPISSEEFCGYTAIGFAPSTANALNHDAKSVMALRNVFFIVGRRIRRPWFRTDHPLRKRRPDHGSKGFVSAPSMP